MSICRAVNILHDGQSVVSALYRPRYLGLSGRTGRCFGPNLPNGYLTDYRLTPASVRTMTASMWGRNRPKRYDPTAPQPFRGMEQSSPPVRGGRPASTYRREDSCTVDPH